MIKKIENNESTKLIRTIRKQMTTILQFFIYKTNGINESNNFPLIQFQTQDDAYKFIRSLKSVRRDYTTTKGYMKLNNPQLIPPELRKYHMFSDNTTATDGIFLIHDNIELLKQCDIDNNTFEEYGFYDFIQQL